MARKQLPSDWKENKVFFDWYVVNLKRLKYGFIEEYRDVYAEFCKQQFKEDGEKIWKKCII